MKKNTEATEQAAEFIIDLTNVVIQHDSKIKKLGRLLFVSIIGFSALGTYLVVKNNK